MYSKCKNNYTKINFTFRAVFFWSADFSVLIPVWQVLECYLLENRGVHFIEGSAFFILGHDGSR
jgi:hypothetical protein